MARLWSLDSCSCGVALSHTGLEKFDNRSAALDFCRRNSSLTRRVAVNKGCYARSGAVKKRQGGVRAELSDADETSRASPSTSEDLLYVGKLFAVCFAGAALVKYGSVLVPAIAEPNLFQAGAMIMTPVLVSVFVLTAASSDRTSRD